MPKINPDHSLPNFTAYSLSRAFFSFGLGLEDENGNSSFFLIMHLGERKLSLLHKKSNINHFARIA